MDKLSPVSINDSNLPGLVSKLCNGLLMISASFCKRNLSAVFDEIEARILKETNRQNNFEAHSVQRSFLNEIKRERDGVTAIFMLSLENRLASIRNIKTDITQSSASPFISKIATLNLIEHNQFEKKQLFTSMVSRCEAQNNTQLYSLRQRFSVLSGKPPFTNEEIPLGPNMLCECILDAIEGLNLNLENTEAIAKIFERRLLDNFSELLENCNQFLIEHKVLSNLNFTAFRNPELRHKKSAIALKNIEPQQPANNQKPIIQDSRSELPREQAVIEDVVQTIGQPSVAQPQRRFNDFRNLLSTKKQQLNVLGDLKEVDTTRIVTTSVAASTDVLNEILSKLKYVQSSSQSFADGAQTIKSQIQTQLTGRSQGGKDLTLTSEDSDAIDLIGILLDSAVQNLKSKSTTTELLTMLQAPLISVALKDKSFFDNTVHPARRMLDTLAETGVNWLDVKDRDEKLYKSVLDIVSGLSKNLNADNNIVQTGYEKTDRLLQTLIKKAETIERRQIEIAKGKERLGIARMHAEDTIEKLISGQNLSKYTKSTLQNAWTDALVLTELRHGYESSNWQAMKNSAVKIIEKENGGHISNDSQSDEQLTTHIQESLQLVGYHLDESIVATDRLLHENNNDSDEEFETPARLIDAGRNNRAKENYQLDEKQIDFVNQIKALPFGTWFEFYSKETGQTERRKMAWASHTTHHMLFVNKRGQKVAEMQIEELAINLSLGFVSIPNDDSRGFFERTLDSAYNSLKVLLPGHGKGAQ